MKKNKKISLILLSVVLIASGFFIPKIKNTYFPFTAFGKAEVMTSKEYIEDLDYLYQLIIDHYPYLDLKKEQYGLDWDAEYQKAKTQLKIITTDKEFEKLLSELVRKLQNGHTHFIEDGDQLLWMYNIYNSFPAKWTKEMIKPLQNANTIARYQLTNDSLKEYRKIEQGKPISENVPDNFTTEILVPSQVAYAHVRQMLSKTDGELYQRDMKNIEHFIEECKDYPVFILDIRGNGGGDSRYWQQMLLPQLLTEKATTPTATFLKDGPLFPKSLKKDYKKIDYLSESEKESIFAEYPTETIEIICGFNLVSTGKLMVVPSKDEHFTGKLYLLVDNGVYSSSEMLAAFCSQTGAATLIGERTGGDGIGSAPFLAVLPHSGLVLRFSKDFGVLENGSINERDQTTPNYIVENPQREEIYDENGNWKWKDDSCIQKVFELIEDEKK